MAFTSTSFTSLENEAKPFPKSVKLKANLVIEDRPVTIDAILSIILAALIATITPIKVLTPSNIEGCICFAPSINGLRLFMKFDKLVPISGKEANIPFAIPPKIPPINCPMAVPTFCRKFPPSVTSQSKPGI